MKKKLSRARSNSKISKRGFHHKALSILKGDGGIYVIFVLATVMAGAFALSGGLVPSLNQTPSASSEVTIDPSSAKQSSKSALQLVDLKVKPTNTPGPTTQACLDKVALNLILDVSASMNNSNKISQLNKAMKNLVNQLKDNTVITAVTFAGPVSFPNSLESVVRLPFTKYQDNKELVSDRLTELTAYNGIQSDGTYMRNAFQRSIDNLDANQSKYLDQGYKFVSIVFTDGVPETRDWNDSTCIVQSGAVCFARNQDPRISPDLTSVLKSRSSKVYSVGIYSGARETQPVIYDEAKKLLGAIASKPEYAKNSKSPEAIDTMFRDVLSSVCQ